LIGDSKVTVSIDAGKMDEELDQREKSSYKKIAFWIFKLKHFQ